MGSFCSIARSFSVGAYAQRRSGMQTLGFEAWIASRVSPERDAVCAMMAAGVLAVQSSKVRHHALVTLFDLGSVNLKEIVARWPRSVQPRRQAQ
jgi:hypothetical protein